MATPDLQMLKVNNRTPPTHTTKMNSSTPSMPPPLEAVYTDLSTATTAIQSHARSYGYALYKRDGKPNRIVYAYDRYRKPPPKRESRSVHESKERKGTRSKKCDCKIRVALEKDMLSGQWESRVLQGAHNHKPLADPSAHPSYRIAALDSDISAQIDKLSSSGLNNTQILAVIRRKKPTVLLSQKDVSNIV